MGMKPFPKALPKNVFLPGTPVVDINTGQEGIILSYKTDHRRHLVHFKDTNSSRLMFRIEFATNCLSAAEYGELFWAWKATLNDERIEELLLKLGSPTEEQQREAYILEHGVDPETHAERLLVAEQLGLR